MAEENKSFLSTAIATAGWVVAALSLGLNFLDYQSKQTERNETVGAKPSYTVTFLSLDPKRFPQEIREVKKPVKQPFKIIHRGGAPVSGLRMTFEAASGGLLDLQIEKGASETKTQLFNGGRELQLSKAVLLKDDIIEGNLITDGLVEVGYRSGAEKGEEYKPPLAASDTSSWYARQEVVILTILSAMLAVTAFALYKTFPHAVSIIKRAGNGEMRSRFIVAAVLSILTLIGFPGNGQIFYAILLYAVVVHFRRLSVLLDRILDASAENTRQVAATKAPTDTKRG